MAEKGMSRMWAGVASLLVVAWAAGCATRPVVAKPVPVGSRKQVIDFLNRQAQATRTVKAKPSVKIQMRSTKESCDGFLAAEYPDKLRIRVTHPLLEYPPLDLGSDGQTWFAHIRTPKENKIDLGPTAALEQAFDPMALLKPRDIVIALGVGRLDENPPTSELLFTRNPGHYLITEIVNNSSGRYVSKRIFVDPEVMAIYKMETYRPDGAIDMIAEMTYDAKAQKGRSVPTSASIRVLRMEAILDLAMRDRQTGVSLPANVFAVPDLERIPNVIQHGTK